MALPSLYDLAFADDATAEEQARALAAALRGQRGGGMLGMATGDKYLAGLGQQMVQGANQQEAGLADMASTRLQRALERQRMAQQGAQFKQEQAFRQSQLDQEAWAATPDASGGVVMYNRKTGEVKPLGPQGPGVGANYPGKPKDLWNDVQQYGTAVEPLAKAAPDIQALRDAAKKDDVSGFGPLAGRVPNLLASDEGVANRQAAGRLMAAIIQATSGQAASEKEVDRLLEANGMGRTATAPMLRQGIEKLAAQYDNLLKQRQAKFHPAVVQAFEQRGGFAGAGSAVSPEDQAAIAWLKANPTDPRAAGVAAKLKAKGL